MSSIQAEDQSALANRTDEISGYTYITMSIRGLDTFEALDSRPRRSERRIEARCQLYQNSTKWDALMSQALDTRAP